MALIVLAVGIRAHADLLVMVGNGVARYDEVSGAFLGAFAQGVSGTGLTFGHEGNLYVDDEVNGKVLRFNGHTFVSLGIFAFGIDTPRGLTFGPDGNLYVSSLFTASIVRFNGNTGAPLGTFATAPGLFPEGLVFGPNGNLYVSDESNGIVLRYNGTTGALIGTFASGPHLSFPAGLTFSRPRGRSPITHLPGITPEH
jgi:streptogramin lyase